MLVLRYRREHIALSVTDNCRGLAVMDSACALDRAYSESIPQEPLANRRNLNTPQAPHWYTRCPPRRRTALPSQNGPSCAPRWGRLLMGSFLPWLGMSHRRFSSLLARIRSVVSSEAVMVSADHFRRELLAQLGRAATNGRIDVLINSAELCRSISNGSTSSVASCEAMQGEFKLGDTMLLDRSNGAGMTVRYLLPRAIDIQISLPFTSNDVGS
jgi:hypothetical protein